jgi:hypothetical protein
MDSIDGNGSTKATATTLYFLRIPILAPRYIRLDKRGIFRVAVELTVGSWQLAVGSWQLLERRGKREEGRGSREVRQRIL